MSRTLEELKADNAKDEEVVDVQNDNEEEQEAESEEESTEESTEAQETVDEESEESKDDEQSDEVNDDWQKSEDEPDKKFTDGDIGKAKTKLRAKLEKQHNVETEQLQARIKELENRPAQADTKQPKLEDYQGEDNPDEAFMIALSDYNFKKSQAELTASNQTNQAQAQQDEQTKEISKNVDSHYDRAGKLTAQSGISSEQYQSADLRVREMLEGLYPNAGDTIADAFISKVGNGSEKVFYNLGVNSTRLMEFKTLLEKDKTGIDAAIFLGKLNSELSAPSKRKTNAPAPAANPKGDKKGGSGVRAQHKKYDEAHKAGRFQDAFNIKRSAKASGTDTASW